jgi:hypothetical protein
MQPDVYDQSSRYLTRRNERALSAWFLALKQQMRFQGWLDTRSIPWPGRPEKVCDTVAWLTDLAREGLLWAVVFEFQIEPDPEMFGRLLIYLGSVWLEKRPGPNPGDRFCVAAVVINLRGRGQAMREMSWEEAGLRVVLQPREWNLEELEATAVLDGVDGGTIPRAVLAWLPLMQGGNRADLIPRWRTLADLETDLPRRSDLGLALVFAEAAGCPEVWQEGLKEWNVIESKIVKKWQDEAEVKGKVGAALHLLSRKFGQIPDEVATQIRATTDKERLDTLIEIAGLVGTLEQFRTDSGL